MTLEELANGSTVVLAFIGGDKALARQIQLRLSEAGLLDLPADGLFGSVSHWPLSEFSQRAGLTEKVLLGRPLAGALLSPGISKARWRSATTPSLRVGSR